MQVDVELQTKDELCSEDRPTQESPFSAADSCVSVSHTSTLTCEMRILIRNITMKAEGKVLVLRAFPSSATRRVKQQTRMCSLHELIMAVTMSTGPAHGLGRAHEAPPSTDGFWERESQVWFVQGYDTGDATCIHTDK